MAEFADQVKEIIADKLGVDIAEVTEEKKFTDDAAVVEAIGEDVSLIEGNRENIKLTTPFDLLVAEALLQNDC